MRLGGHLFGLDPVELVGCRIERLVEHIQRHMLHEHARRRGVLIEDDICREHHASLTHGVGMHEDLRPQFAWHVVGHEGFEAESLDKERPLAAPFSAETLLDHAAQRMLHERTLLLVGLPLEPVRIADETPDGLLIEHADNLVGRHDLEDLVSREVLRFECLVEQGGAGLSIEVLRRGLTEVEDRAEELSPRVGLLRVAFEDLRGRVGLEKVIIRDDLGPSGLLDEVREPTLVAFGEYGTALFFFCHCLSFSKGAPTALRKMHILSIGVGNIDK